MIVVKLGGGHGINYDAFCDDVAKIQSAGETLIVVHGGSARLNEIAAALGRPPRFITSPQGITSRWTDREAMECFLMTYCGLINKTLIELLQQRQVNAIGLSGMDGGVWTGPRKDVTQVVEDGVRRVLRGNLTGRVDRVNTKLLRTLIDEGYLPVLTPPALSDDQSAINVDGDRAAARTAIEMQAESLLILTNQPGVLRDLSDPQSAVAELWLTDDLSREHDYVQGRMRIKLLAASEALRGGVRRVIICDGRQPNCIERGLAGSGTIVRLAPDSG
jgi:[amino group carrier protein]-L-2-aminoadipate/L-glutamate 6-kinase